MNHYILSDPPPRYCGCCRQKMPVAGGQYVKIDKYHQQWRCKPCLDRHAS